MNDHDRRWCFNQLSRIMKLPISKPFLNPVDEGKDNAPDYYQIISRPMDLTTIRNKLKANRYVSADEFIADIRLISNNTVLYNGEKSYYYLFSRDILRSVLDERKKKPSDEAEQWEIELKENTDRLADIINHPPPKIYVKRPPISMPNIRMKDLKSQQIKDIQTLIGTPIEELSERWQLLNEKTQERIKLILRV